MKQVGDGLEPDFEVGDGELIKASKLLALGGSGNLSEVTTDVARIGSAASHLCSFILVWRESEIVRTT